MLWNGKAISEGGNSYEIVHTGTFDWRKELARLLDNGYGVAFMLSKPVAGADTIFVLAPPECCQPSSGDPPQGMGSEVHPAEEL